MFSLFDAQMMQAAIKLAKGGIFTTFPNPNVGCVITQEDRLVGEGFHVRAGEPHAEIHALHQAKEKAKGATVYVTLEPCSHFGRTPPCADALIAAKVRRVVCAMTDPNPNVAGKGIERLRNAGIVVDVGLLQEEAEALNRPFIKKMKTGLPYVQLKLAGSLDGRTALKNGQSQWITSPKAREDVQVFRAQAGAVLSTSQTVLDDNPSLNVRWEQLPSRIQAKYPKETLRQPLRVILDAQGKIPPSAKLFSLPGDILILTQKDTGSFSYQNEISHVEVIKIGHNEGRFDLSALLRILAEKGIYHIWVEAGATLAGSLIKEDLVDELIIYQAPLLLGADSRPLMHFTGLTLLDDAPRFVFNDMHPLGDDVRFRLTKSTIRSKLKKP